jgi:hypothetical protein
MSRAIKTKKVSCKVCGKPVEVIQFGDQYDQIGHYVHPECAEPLAVGSTAPSPRPISDLLKLAEDTIGYARRVLPVRAEPSSASTEQSVKYLVLLSFAHKILKSTEAVTLLCQRGYGEDAIIITRSIVEAVINAGLIESLDPRWEALRRWSAYKIALQWRLYLRGKKFDPAKKIFTPENVKKHKEQFEQVAKWFLIDPQKGINDPGNISRSWLTKRKRDGKLEEEDIYEMARKLDGIEQRRRKLAKCDDCKTLMQVYNFGSDYAHSNTLAVESYCRESEDGKLIFQSSPSQQLVWQSLWFAVDGLTQSLRIVNRVKSLGLEKDLEALYNRLYELDKD